MPRDQFLNEFLVADLSKALSVVLVEKQVKIFDQVLRSSLSVLHQGSFQVVNTDVAFVVGVDHSVELAL